MQVERVAVPTPRDEPGERLTDERAQERLAALLQLLQGLVERRDPVVADSLGFDKIGLPLQLEDLRGQAGLSEIDLPVFVEHDAWYTDAIRTTRLPGGWAVFYRLHGPAPEEHQMASSMDRLRQLFARFLRAPRALASIAGSANDPGPRVAITTT